MSDLRCQPQHHCIHHLRSTTINVADVRSSGNNPINRERGMIGLFLQAILVSVIEPVVPAHQIVLNEDAYSLVLGELVAGARRLLWLVTADIKDLHVKEGRRFVPFLKIIAGKLAEGVEVRLIHAKEPGPRFREDFDRFPELVESENFERILCPRMHMKCVVADGRRAYIGSANLTGAGMGAKNPQRRNFEAGIVTEDPGMVGELMEFLDSFYLGDHCRKCQLRAHCPDPIV